MSKTKSALVAVAVAMTAATARAETVTDPITDFSIDLDLHAKDTCVVIPRDRAEGAFCEDVGPSGLADSLDRIYDQPFYAAAARADDGLVVVSITRDGVRDPLRADQLADFAQKLRAEVAGRAGLVLADDLPPPSLERIRDVVVAVVPMRGQVQADDEHTLYQSLVSFTLFGKRASYRIVASSDSAHEAAAVGVVRGALATMTLAPAMTTAPKTATGLADDLRAHARAVAIAAVVLLALLFGGWRFTRDPPAPDAPEGPRFRTRKRKVSWQKGDR